MRKLLYVFCLAFWPGFLPAADQQFTFALPELEGRISLGVFSSGGNLVRTLAVGAKETDFKIGLNGLIATWDGKDSEGNPMPAGKYQIRGFVVGEELKTEGEAYHFNDWVEDEKSPRITRIEDFCRLPEGFLLLVRLLDGSPFETTLLCFDDKGALRWRAALSTSRQGSPLLPGSVLTPAPFQTNGPKPRGGDVVMFIPGAPPVASPSLVAAGRDFAAALASSGLFVVKLSDGSQANAETTFGLPACALTAFDQSMLAASAGGLTRALLPDLKNQKNELTPVAFTSLTADASRQIGGIGTEDQIWVSLGQAWEKMETGIFPTSLSLGVDETFWVTGKLAEGGDVLTGQFNHKGEFLRAYRDGFAPRKVVASTTSEEIAVLEEEGLTQRLRVLKFAEKKDDASSDWEIIFEKSLTPCGDFGLVEGKLVADTGVPKRPVINITLNAGGLTATPPKLQATVVTDGAALWLQTDDGLRLRQLAAQPGLTRVVVADGPNADSKRIYAGDGAVVAEYIVTGLGHIAEIEAGEIELP